MGQDTPRPWYENALLLAVAGSLIAVIGQLAGTIIPIMYGPEDVSDFSIGVDPVEATLFLFPENNSYAIRPPFWQVKVKDFHPHLRPYRFGVLLRNFEVPEGIDIAFHLSEIRPGEVSRMNLTMSKFAISSLKEGEYPITIHGVGGDGKTRNTTFFLDVLHYSLTKFEREQNQTEELSPKKN